MGAAAGSILGTRHAPARLARAAIAALALVAVIAAGGWMVTEPGVLRIAVAGALMALMAGLAFNAPRELLVLLLVWLAALGLARRLLTEFDAVARADPLLLVGPAAVIMLALAALRAGALERLSALATTVLALDALIVLAAFNPLQGSILGGLVGLLFVLVPTLGFWIGRALVDDATLRRVLKVVAVLATLAAAYGLYQTFRGFPSWDEAWIRSKASGYVSLTVLGATRPFSMFSAAAEYGFFLAIGALVWLLFGLRGRTILPALAAVGLIGVAAFYQSSRGVAVMLVVAMGVVLAARLRLGWFASGLAAAVLLALLVVGATTIEPSTRGNNPAARLAAHQARGLADPLDPESSTVLVHLELIRDGVSSVATQPLGHGVGAVTIAGERYGGLNRNTEADPSNAAVAMGAPGLAVFVLLVAFAFASAYGLARRRRDALALAALGVLTVTLFQWLNGGQYAVSLLPWLVLGWIDRERHSGSDGLAEEAA